MNEVRRRLEQLELPDEHGARARSWEVLRTGFAGREPAPRPTRRLRPVLALAAAAAFVAAAVSPPGRAVLDGVRERVAGVEGAERALFRLPADAPLLVSGETGTWVVSPDGSRRLLGDYRDASWSPHGRFVVAVRQDELAALEPDGDVRWTLARPAVTRARWGGTATDTRVAYVSGGALRVVAGDGRGDRQLAPAVRAPAPAWRPGAGHVLAYLDAEERVVVVAADTGRTLWRSQFVEHAFALAWSDDGERLVAIKPRGLSVYGADGRHLAARSLPGTVTAAAFAPGSHRLAVARELRGRGQLFLFDANALGGGARLVFHGEGRFTGLAWSPDGAWLLVAWRDADQWVFLRSAGVRRLEAVADVSEQLGGSFPRLGGWCCTPAAR